MAIEAAAMSTASTTSTTNINSSSISKSSAPKTGNESFKDEMDKISEDKKVKESENTEETEKSDNKNAKVDDKNDIKNDEKSVKNTKEKTSKTNKEENNLSNEDINVSGLAFAQISLNDANTRLSDDIYQMMNSNTQLNGVWGLSFDGTSSQGALSMNESDAQFFINLTQTNDISMANISAQTQIMTDNGANTEQVQKSAQVSQALLDALNNAREKNQPVRVDFDKNISVVLRVSHNGTIAAHFIPGDKAVEQYLRNNIETLKNTFDENNLPYTDLSYSRNGREQNRRRREQQGE